MFCFIQILTNKRIDERCFVNYLNLKFVIDSVSERDKERDKRNQRKRMTTITERIVLLNQQLELFKSSIDVLIQQNNENVNAIKKWENKQFTLVREEI